MQIPQEPAFAENGYSADNSTRDAVAVLKRLEQADPKNGLALFYLGAADFAAGDRKGAAARWKTLLSMLPPDAPIRPLLEERIREADAKP